MPIEKLVEGHRHFVATFARAESHYLRQLAEEGQNPDTLIVSCSDSRVIPELITGAAPGHLFVVRNIANIIPPFASQNMSVGAAIEYAVEVLEVSHIVVLGHYGCGGMAALRGLFGPGGKAAEKPADDPLVSWLRYGEPSYHEAVHKGVLDTPAWLDTLVEENVLQQLAHLIEYPVVQKAVEARKVTLHAWAYSLERAMLNFFDADSAKFVAADAINPETDAGHVTLDEIRREDHV
jgi:carbonic anhydrase